MTATADLRAQATELAALREQRKTADENAARGRLRVLCALIAGAVRSDLRAIGQEAAPVLAVVDNEDWHGLGAAYRFGTAELIVTSARELRHVVNEEALDRFLGHVEGLTHEDLIGKTSEARLWHEATELIWRPVQAVEQLQRLRLLLSETLDAIATREPGPVEEIRFPADDPVTRPRSKTTYRGAP